MNKKTFLIYLVFFLIGDIFFSNFVYKRDINHNCYEQLNDFFQLKKNCYAREKWIKNVQSYDVRTDENGFRFSGKKKDKSKTAIFFGDSFTYGMGLDYKKTFVGLIENGQQGYKTLNLGVPGYSPSVFNYQFKEILKKEKNIKKIFLVLDISDVSEEASQWEIKIDSDRPIQINKENKKEKNESPHSFLNSIKENFTGSRLIARSINNFFRSVRLYFLNIKKPEVPGYSGWGNFLYMDIENTDSSLWHPFGFNEGLNKIIKNSMEISSLAKSINAEIYIIIYPWPDSLEYGQDKFNWENFSNKLCSAISCKKIINFFPDFQVIKENNADWLTRLYINGDLHISEYGHKIIATKILKEVF